MQGQLIKMFDAIDILSYSIYSRAHHGWARRKIVKIEVLGRLENASLRLVFANTVFHKRAMLVSIYTEYTESLLDILLHLESTLGLLWLGLGKNFQKEGSQKTGKCYFKNCVCVFSTDIEALCSLQLLNHYLTLSM